MSDAPPTFPTIESRSSLFEKLPPDLRRRLDQAIIDRDPPAYRTLHARFNLAEYGVSPTALYYYVRRLRAQADMLHLAQLAVPDSPDLAEALPTLLAYRLLDALLDEDTPPKTLLRLVDAGRIASNHQLAVQRQAALLDDDRRRSAFGLPSADFGLFRFQVERRGDGRYGDGAVSACFGLFHFVGLGKVEH